MEENKMLTSNRKETKKRRILLLLLLVGITGIMLTTTSYAWFTANTSVSINTITVNVAAKNGIQISTDGTSWKSIIQTTDITSAHNTYAASINQLPNILEPVSTIGDLETTEHVGFMKMFYGETQTNVGGDYILTSSKSTETRFNGAEVGANHENHYFVAFDVFLKYDTVEADRQTIPLYITTASGVTATGADDGIQNASRIGFVIQGHTNSGDSLANVQALASGTAPVYFWEPNARSHIATGVTAAYNTYGITTTNGGMPLAYEGVKDEIETADDVLLTQANSAISACYSGTTRMPAYTTQATCQNAGTCSNPDYNNDGSGCTGDGGTWTSANYTWTAYNANFFAPVNTVAGTLEQPITSPASVDGYTATINGFATQFTMFNITAGITKVRIYMWVEGQDVDCENNASGETIRFDLGFSIE